MFATYIHDLNPILLQLGETIAIRWYGIAYLIGFVAGYFLLKYLSGKNLYPIAQERLSDFITWTAVFGVLLGGRLGYVIFYWIPNRGLDAFLADPLTAVRVWEGGMASHGGIIGVTLFTLYYARKHGINWVAITDGLAIVAPVGLFFGRMANFINGELYGRIIHSHSWVGMKFPAELHENMQLRHQALQKIYDECPDSILQNLAAASPLPDRADAYSAQWMIERVRDTPAIKDIVGSVLPERYPSQLYEGLAEGIILFTVLWGIRILYPKAYNGIFSGIFCFLYAIGRIIVENYREPDSPVWFNLTRGQFLSLFLFLIGTGFFIYAFKTKKTVQAVN